MGEVIGCGTGKQLSRSPARDCGERRGCGVVLKTEQLV